VSKEDRILDSVSLCRATRPGQVGGAKELENDISFLTAEAAHHSDRESVMCFFSTGCKRKEPKDDVEFLGSQVLGMIACDIEAEKPPTVLHEVGTWQRPATPSSSSKIRLVDAAIQAFAATFSLKSGKEQQSAMVMLESMAPPVYYQGSRGMGAPSEQDRRSKVRTISWRKSSLIVFSSALKHPVLFVVVKGGRWLCC
jgi:hypothetical protein